MKKVTTEQLVEILRDNQDKLIAFINFADQTGHLVDIESICINGNAVQLEAKPFPCQNRYHELSHNQQIEVDKFINSVASGRRNIFERITK